MSMDNTSDVTDSSTEEVESQEDSQETEETSQEEESESTEAPTKTKVKPVPFERFSEVNNELKKLKAQPQQSSIDSLELIKLGKKLQDYSDTELDFVTDYAKSNKPADILKALENPFVQAGINAHREKVEKEQKALAPSSTQTESDKPVSLSEKLKSASLAEQEEILSKIGGYKAPRNRTDGRHITK